MYKQDKNVNNSIYGKIKLRGVAMLLKGVNKRVIVIKNPGSEIFEEAYFIIKSGGVKGVIKQSKENEMVIEANRIISDYHNQQRSIIEKNGIASSIGGDMSELDNFLNGKKDNISKINNTEKTEKNKKENKFGDIKNIKINQSMANLSDEEIFEDEKIFENMQINEKENENENKYDDFYRSSDFIGYSEEEKSFKSAFDFISAKKIRKKNNSISFSFPPRSFFIGVGFMSAVIILIRLIEYILLK